MKKISFVLLVVFVAALAAGCSLFGGGDWKSGVVETLKAEHDDFTLETRYSMQESGLYYSILPVKLSCTPATADEDSWWQLTITQYDTMGFDSLVMNSVAIMNSRGDRFNVDYFFGGVSFGDETTGGARLTEDEVSQLYQVFTDIDNLEFIRIRFNGDDSLIYEMTQPQAYAVLYFIDYIRNNVQPTEA